MEQSTIHIKAPHTIHIAAKVQAAKRGTSMNQYIIKLIADDVGEDELDHTEIGIELYRTATLKQREAIDKVAKSKDREKTIEENRDVLEPLASKVFGKDSNSLEFGVIKTPEKVEEQLQAKYKELNHIVVKFCKEGHPIPEGRSKCLGKGCKYS